jgi:hypothetical protein
MSINWAPMIKIDMVSFKTTLTACLMFTPTSETETETIWLYLRSEIHGEGNNGKGIGLSEASYGLNS